MSMQPQMETDKHRYEARCYLSFPHKWESYDLIARRFKQLKQTAALLKSSLDEIPRKVESLQDELADLKKELAAVNMLQTSMSFDDQMKFNVEIISGVPVLIAQLPDSNADMLRSMVDKFKQQYTGGTVLLGSVIEDKPILVSGSNVDTKSNFNAIDVVKIAAEILGGSAGGRPTLAQAGGKNPEKMNEALEEAKKWIRSKLSE